MRLLFAATLLAGFAERNNLPSGPVDLQASAETGETGTVHSIEAMAVKGFSAPSGKLQWVKLTEHMYIAGEPAYVGDFVQVTEAEAKRFETAGRAVLATDEEVAAAQKGSKK